MMESTVGERAAHLMHMCRKTKQWFWFKTEIRLCILICHPHPAQYAEKHLPLPTMGLQLNPFPYSQHHYLPFIRQEGYSRLKSKYSLSQKAVIFNTSLEDRDKICFLKQAFA